MNDVPDCMRRLAEHIRRIDEGRGTDKDLFLANHTIHDYVVFQLVQIGELARKLPEGFRREQAAIPWQEMIAFRNVLVHNYEALDLDVVWNIVESDLPALRRFVLDYMDKQK